MVCAPTIPPGCLNLGSNAPDTCGEPAEEPERIRAAILRAQEWGVDTRIHAIGDRSVRFVLDCFEEGERLHGKRDCRHSMEHNETVQPEICCATRSLHMPRHATVAICCSIWLTLLGTMPNFPSVQRGPAQPACQRCRGALCSDFPVVGLEPMEGRCTARSSVCFEDGSNPEGWFPQERTLRSGRGPARLHLRQRLRHACRGSHRYARMRQTG